MKKQINNGKKISLQQRSLRCHSHSFQLCWLKFSINCIWITDTKIEWNLLRHWSFFVFSPCWHYFVRSIYRKPRQGPGIGSFQITVKSKFRGSDNWQKLDHLVIVFFLCFFRVLNWPNCEADLTFHNVNLTNLCSLSGTLLLALRWEKTKIWKKLFLHEKSTAHIISCRNLRTLRKNTVSQQKDQISQLGWQHICPKYIYIYVDIHIVSYIYKCFYIYIYIICNVIYFQNYKYNDFYYKVFQYLHNNISLTPMWQFCV